MLKVYLTEITLFMRPIRKMRILRQIGCAIVRRRISTVVILNLLIAKHSKMRVPIVARSYRKVHAHYIRLGNYSLLWSKHHILSA